MESVIVQAIHAKTSRYTIKCHVVVNAMRTKQSRRTKIQVRVVWLFNTLGKLI